MSSTRKIITGAAGFIGRNLTKAVLLNSTQDDTIVCIDIQDMTSLGFEEANINGANLILIQKNMKDITPDEYNIIFDVQEDQDEEEQKEFFLTHLASSVGVDKILESPQAITDDLIMNSNLINYLNNLPDNITGRVVFTSSSEIYGEQTVLEETTDLKMQSPENYLRGIYASQKLITEHLFLNSLINSKTDVRILRLFSITGRDQSTDFVTPKLIEQAVNNQDITIYGDGSQSRAFMHIDDLINIILHEELFSTLSDGTDNKIINAANPRNLTTIFQLANLIKTLTASSSEIVFEDGPIGETSRIPQINRLNKFYRPQIDLSTIIKSIVETQFPEKELKELNSININTTEVQEDEIDYIEFEITGNTEPEATIIIEWADSSLDSTEADAEGNWTIEVKKLKEDVQNEVATITAQLNTIVFSAINFRVE